MSRPRKSRERSATGGTTKRTGKVTRGSSERRRTEGLRLTSDAREILARHDPAVPELEWVLSEEFANLEVATQIYELRTARGLTQAQLAERVGTSQSAIARLEDADYRGHGLRMLHRVANALGARVSVSLIPGCK